MAFTVVSRALLLQTLLFTASGHVGAASDEHDSASYPSAEDLAVVLLQDVKGLSLMRKEAARLEEGGGGGGGGDDFEDASSFAQTEVSVEEAPAVAPAQAPAAGDATAGEAAAPAWMPQGQQQAAGDEEELTCSLQGLTPGVCAMAALAQAPPKADRASGLDFLRPERLERALFSEIESALAGTHAGFTAARLAEVENELRGLFGALPKNDAGLLGTATTRYAVHQRFLRKHAWYVRSLNPAGEAQKHASEAEALRAHVPQHLQELIEKRQGGRGLGLRELAALVATLEHLIQGDMGERLKAAYASHGLSANSTANVEEVADALKTFMAHFLSLEHRSGYAISPAQAKKERREIESAYDGWAHVTDAVDAVLLEGHPSGASAADPLRFADALSSAKKVMTRFAAYSRTECRGVKTSLAALPGGSSGRVRLTDFHMEAIDGEPIFSESTAYLTNLGALDQSVPGSPFVLVPNYVYSPSNCVGTTSFFDQCCANECEDVLEYFERALETPEATPGQIAEVLGGWRDEALSAPLRRELELAAEAHGGRVGLHGLAFAEWLNRAFPLECPKPRPEDFKARGGREAEVPDAEAEFQAVAGVRITASKAELLQELMGNDTAAALLATEDEEDEEEAEEQDELEDAAARALGLATAGASRGLKVSPLPDATSLAQTVVEAAPSEAEADSLERAEGPAQAQTNTLRVKKLS